MDVSNDSVAVTVGELNRESLESMALRHVVLYTLLEFSRCEVASANSFKFITQATMLVRMSVSKKKIN